MIVSAPHATSALFLDVDGSLIDIAARPEAVVVPTALIDALRSVSDVMEGAVALVSGRSIRQLDELFAPWCFRASGVHGAEMRFDPQGPVVDAADRLPRGVWNDLSALLDRFPGTLVEDKLFSYAIHYRAVPTAGPALEIALRALLERTEPGLRLMPGHFVFEIKGAAVDKGSAVRRFMREPAFAGRSPIFVGDDVTDQPGFAAAVEAGGYAYGVGRDIPGTSGTFADPSAVRSWVAALAATETVHA